MDCAAGWINVLCGFVFANFVADFVDTETLGPVFIKQQRNPPGMTDILRGEFTALDAISAVVPHFAPHAYFHGTLNKRSFLVSQYINLKRPSPAFCTRFAENLASLHINSHSDEFGFCETTMLGSTPQLNTPASDWVAFWRPSRLDYLMKMIMDAYNDTEMKARVDIVAHHLGSFLNVAVKPSLLHGDLCKWLYLTWAAYRKS